jgi:hypothetical protein
MLRRAAFQSGTATTNMRAWRTPAAPSTSSLLMSPQIAASASGGDPPITPWFSSMTATGTSAAASAVTTARPVRPYPATTTWSWSDGVGSPACCAGRGGGLRHRIHARPSGPAAAKTAGDSVIERTVQVSARS